ncbi:MAG: DUF4363 family protein [Ruminococcaceae bacterium]|nr:DUF4363 family protein [Oscillospiraceae bacterium]
MRSVIIPTVLIIFALTFTVCTERSAVSSLDELIELTESLPDTPDSETEGLIDEIERLWKKHEKLYMTVMKKDQINIFLKELSSARSGLLTDDDGTYVSSKNSMLITLKYIRKSQELCLLNML